MLLPPSRPARSSASEFRPCQSVKWPRPRGLSGDLRLRRERQVRCRHWRYQVAVRASAELFVVGEREQQDWSPVIAMKLVEFHAGLSLKISAYPLRTQCLEAHVQPRRVAGEIGIDFLRVSGVQMQAPELMIQTCP
jgi:hypothetical protein